MIESESAASAATPVETPSKGQTFLADLLASVVVFLVALPLCMGIAIASGVPVAYGLITGIVGGILVGSIAGSPLQVSGPAAGLAVIIADLVREHGIEVLGITVLFAGVIQAIAGMLKLGQWFRAVSPAVIEGMLAGIGVLIFASQFHVMVDDTTKGNGLQNLITIPEAIRKGLPWPNLADRPLRKAVIAANHDVGQLHADQQQVAETYAEHFADGQTDEIFDYDSAIADQRAIQAGLVAVADRVAEEGILEGDSAAGREPALTRAIAAVTAALQALEAREPAEELLEEADRSLYRFETTLKNHSVAAKIGLFTILVIIVWQFLCSTKAFARLKVVPAPLVAVVLATLLAYLLAAPVMYVEIPSDLLEQAHHPTWTSISSFSPKVLLVQALVIALVASAETLLCASAVDQMHSGARTKYNKELFAQGVGNTLCGILGALPMTGVIVRSGANVQAGGKTRLSAILHGIWLLLLCAVFSKVLTLIPVASLAAILVYTGYRLMGLQKIAKLWRERRGEAFVFFATVATIVAFDLLTGVLVGVVLATIKMAVTMSRLQIDRSTDADGTEIVSLDGSATFFSLPKLAAALESIRPGTDVELNMDRMQYIDHSCVELLGSFERQHRASGGTLRIDWPLIEQASDEPLKFNPQADTRTREAILQAVEEERTGIRGDAKP